MFDFWRKPKPDLGKIYPFRVGLNCATQADRDELIITLCAALKLLNAAEPENETALAVWQTVYRCWPHGQPRLRSSNIVQFPDRRMAQ